jgi:hypothetical protein
LIYTPAPNASGLATVTVNVTDPATGDLSHTETFTIRVDKPHALYNVVQPCDVTDDDVVGADDALAVINYINAKGSMQTTDVSAASLKRYFYDVDRDNWIAAIDVLVIINHINAQSANQSANQLASNAAGEAVDPSLLALVAQDAADATTGKRKV